MLTGNKNLKNSEGQNIKDAVSMPATYQSLGFGSVSYNKTHKLITALYMVTDIMDKEEPIRNKLRTLGLEIISDSEGKPMASYGASTSITRIDQIMSFLDIASAMNFISEMNGAILKKEFLALKESIQELDVKPVLLEGFFEEPSLDGLSKTKGNKFTVFSSNEYQKKGELNSKGHTRIGVQKGSTLLQALSKVSMSDRTRTMSDNNFSNSDNSVLDVSGDAHGHNFSSNTHSPKNNSGFDILKKKRRESIVDIIKNNGESSTIKDIKNKINIGAPEASICSEKTLQRELVSMIKDGVLKKTGEKRWSRYFIK